MNYTSIENAILNGKGIQDIAHCNNGAWNAFTNIVDNYYAKYFNYDDDSAISIARSIVAWRMHTAWYACSNSDIILAIIINFAHSLNSTASQYNSTPNMQDCYNELTYFMYQFVTVFGITYSK